MAKFAQSPLFLVLVCVAAIKGVSAICTGTTTEAYSYQLNSSDYTVACTAAGTATVTFTIPTSVSNIVEFGIIWGESPCLFRKATSIPVNRQVVFTGVPCGVTVSAWGVNSNTNTFYGTNSPTCFGWGNGGPGSINNAAGCRVRKLANALLISCDTPTNAGQVCNIATPVPCDVDDTWSAGCSCLDSVALEGVQCNTASTDPADICDDSDICDGVTKVCADRVLADQTQCAPADGPCDLPDVCNGQDKTCEDVKQAEGFECRPKASPCDAAEVCDGTSKTCPDDICQWGGIPAGPACPARRRLF